MYRVYRKKVDRPFQIQISHNLLKYRIFLSDFVPWVENLVFLRHHYNRLWLIWIWKGLLFFIHPVESAWCRELASVYTVLSSTDLKVHAV